MFQALLPFLLAAAPAMVPATVDVSPIPAPVAAAEDAEARWVPFALTPGGQVRFAMEIDGRPIAAILDTGVSHSVLARRSSAYDGARTRPGGAAAAIGGAVAIDWMRTHRLAFGGLVRSGGEIAVADLPARATGAGDAVDILVGRDLLEGHALDIDYPGRRFRLVASGRLPFAGDTAPLAVSPARQVYETSVTLGGRTIGPVILDTGDGAQLTMTEAGWRAGGEVARVTSALSYGVAGPETTGLAIAVSAALGEAAAGPVEVRIEAPGGLSHRIGVAGRIGSGLLRDYRVLLDPGAGRMVLRRQAAAAMPPPRSTSGLLVGIAQDRLRVLHVMRGSPAAARGWRDGEEVCQVDGEPIGPGYAATPAAAWTAGAPGRTVSLRLCDGARRRLTLQRFY